jgi:hypothetical protein
MQTLQLITINIQSEIIYRLFKNAQQQGLGLVDQKSDKTGAGAWSAKV